MPRARRRDPSQYPQETYMIVVLFRSKLVDPPVGYDEMAAEMAALAPTMPGFVDVKSFKADDGERLTVVWWENEETLRGWREQAQHRVAQRMGRERWYEYYKLEVAEVIRTSQFERRSTAAAVESGS
jgi:heme-degrading monooxygenase HmoA